jgi:DNA-binding MarR family transcriptional regulator
LIASKIRTYFRQKKHLEKTLLGVISLGEFNLLCTIATSKEICTVSSIRKATRMNERQLNEYLKRLTDTQLLSRESARTARGIRYIFTLSTEGERLISAALL